MNTYIFLYPETSFFEVDLTAYFMKTQGNVKIATERNQDIITTNEGIRIVSDIFIDELSVQDIDVFIVCGGEIDNIADKPLLYQKIRDCRDQNKIIGGICAGRTIVADALHLTCHSETTHVINEKIVLSPGNEYVDFALEIGKTADIYQDEADYLETVNYFKLFQAPLIL